MADATPQTPAELTVLPSSMALLSTAVGHAVDSFAARIAMGAYPIPAWIREKSRDPEVIKATVAVIALRGHSLGLDPFTSMEDFYEIKGRMGLMSRGIAAVILNSGLCAKWEAGCREEPTRDGKGTTLVGYCKSTRKGMDPQETTFSWADAVRAKYPEKNNKYNEDPKAMLTARAISMMGRNLYPDVMRGMAYSVEELHDIDGPPDKRIEAVPVPKPGETVETGPKPRGRKKAEAPAVVDAAFTPPSSTPPAETHAEDGGNAFSDPPSAAEAGLVYCGPCSRKEQDHIAHGKGEVCPNPEPAEAPKAKSSVPQEPPPVTVPASMRAGIDPKGKAPHAAPAKADGDDLFAGAFSK